MSARYIAVAETAKLVRAALKRAFPAVKFSVRSQSYAGGSCANIGWTDGPTDSRVSAIVARFSGVGFDSSTDCRTYHDSVLLPDGSLGERGADGRLPAGAELVHFAPSISTRRDDSPERETTIRLAIEAFIGRPLEDNALSGFRSYQRDDGSMGLASDATGGDWGSVLLRSVVYRIESPEAFRP